MATLSASLLASGPVSPRVGRIVERRGGRSVVAFGTVVMAVGLFALAARSLPAYVGGWIVLGIGMRAAAKRPEPASAARNRNEPPAPHTQR